MDEARRAELEMLLKNAMELGDEWGSLKENMIRDLKKELAGNARGGKIKNSYARGGKIKKSYAKGGGVRKPKMGVN